MDIFQEQSVELIAHMGSDLTVVNAARVSFDKESDWETIDHEEEIDVDFRSISITPVKRLSERDERLIKYLASHNHWTPFGHAQATFRITCPIFVARQLHKHQVGFVVNEVSRRYIDTAPKFFVPGTWRERASDKKQGSKDSEVEDSRVIDMSYKHVCSAAFNLYERMLASGVCPEQARMVLPQSMMTQFYMTGSLYGWIRVCKLRLDEHAQEEIREIASMIGGHIKKLFPVTWRAYFD